VSLKQKTISGLLWSFIDSFASQGVQFIVGVILARLLSPREFGLIGMLTIFIAVSQSFIDSGFTSALIRRKNCTQDDYATVFYFNIIVSLVLYLLLFLLSGAISSFFNEPQLKSLIQVLGIGLIFNSLAIIQRTILTKELNFKLQMRVSVFSSLGSGILAVFMAFQGFGVWSLVALTLSRFGFTSFFLWVWSKWKPIWVFSRKSFNELFSFGSKLLVSGLIDTIYRNVYNLIIGKYFSAVELGFYSQADQFQSLPSQNLNGIITRVSYPVLSSIQNDNSQLRSAYKKLIKSTMLITFVLMLGLCAVAKPLILTLIGEKWLPAVIYLQLLCFVGMFYPLHALNLNMLQVQGRSDLFLRLEIIKKIIAIPAIVIGIFFGIKIMILGMLVNTLIAYYLNSFWSGKLIGYSFSEQVKDILPGFLLALTVSAIVFLIGIVVILSPAFLLILQITTGAVLTIGTCELFKIQDYLFMKETLFEKLIGIKL
jgi:O-antigen/teichoic acid export membrane protein